MEVLRREMPCFPGITRLSREIHHHHQHEVSSLKRFIVAATLAIRNTLALVLMPILPQLASSDVLGTEKTSLQPGSQSIISSLSEIHPHLHQISIMRFIMAVTFVIGNTLALVPTSILNRDSSTFRALVSSIMFAFASAIVSLLLIHYEKTGFAARACRCSSIVAMAAVLALLLSVSALHGR